ncbi:Ger(x)C family spore germination protein [Paenibacillus sp. LMG 31458]|uniref:Ger(X)C family spore germination protein n=1 Tax=Paenibacillus phytorum TaxID=2654977 RepID=A0ABX1XR68_9BACL|nr:Ger(x)C family spore germination protein [Paenibacillus phytorum]NOU71043.1 Ger(x)C family spore germination protein [Paenibacillus phytorum]
MNKRRFRKMLFVVFVVLAAGCSDRLDMEDATFALLVGFDLDKENKLLVYSTTPVFSQSAEKKTREIGVTSQTNRQSREKQDSYAPGVFQGRSIQVILVSKRILQQENWFQLTDIWFRDPKNPLTSRVIAFDGPISEIIHLNPKDQPMLPLLLRDMVETKYTRSETVKTTLQELHNQMREKGQTPYISEVRLLNKQIAMTGITLLDNKGEFADSLNIQESILLQILQNSTKKAVSLTLPIPGQVKIGPFHTYKLSINAEKIKTKVKTSYQNDKFQFDIAITMRVGLTELMFPYDVRSQGKELENKITIQVQKQLESLIHKIQADKIDPMGLGFYARAHEYSHFKKVEDNWGETLAKADIHVSVKTTIGAMGTVK